MSFANSLRNNSLPETGLARAVFLDRDGTLIVNTEYSADPAALAPMPGAFLGLRELQREGFRLIIITNQSGIARGLFSEAALKSFNDLMMQMFAINGVTLDALYYCPHLPDGIVPEFSRVCDCRKPEPGLILRAAKEHRINLGLSWMVGDSPRDTAAGRLAGCRTIRIGSSGEDEPAADFDAPDLAKAAEIILNATG